MSKISITPNASGTGVFTISSPATNTNRSLTLPDEAGTVLTSASSLASANLTGAVTVSGSDVTISGTLHSVGHIIQTQYAIDSTLVSLSQTHGTYSTIVQVNITPKYATSKILITGFAAVDLSGGNYPAIHCKIYRDGTDIKTYSYWGYEGPVNTHRILMEPLHYLDSPTTTSALTYYVKISNSSGSAVSGTYSGMGNQYNSSVVTVQEIAQ